MAVPKSKITKSRRGMRRSHDAIDNDALDKTSEFYIELKKVKDALPKPPE